MNDYASLFSTLGKKIVEDSKRIFGIGKKFINKKIEKTKKIHTSNPTPLYPKNCAKVLGPYSPAIDSGEFIFFSGQIAIDNEGIFHNESLQTEAEQIFKNIDALLNVSKCKKNNIVKTTVFLSDISNFDEFNTLYSNYLENHKPARSCVQVTLPKNARIEIEVIVKK